MEKKGILADKKLNIKLQIRRLENYVGSTLFKVVLLKIKNTC